MRKRVKYFYGISFSIIGLLACNFSIAQQASLSISPNSGTFIQGCEYPFTINMDTDSFDVSTLDVKLFLSGFEAISILNGEMDNLAVLSGIATIGPKSGKTYEYLNVYQNSVDQSVSGTVELATLNLFVTTGIASNGSIEFYIGTSGRNGDDSNISFAYNFSDQNTYTQYEDMLYFVLDGGYDFVSGVSCDNLPVIVSGQYLQQSNKDSGYDYQTILSQIIAGYDFGYPISYLGDTNRNNRVYDTGRTIWTNTAVTLVITGNKPIQIYEDGLTLFPISVLDNTTQSTGKTMLITGNLSSQLSFFSDPGILNNLYEYGTGAGFHTGVFFIDVFRIDHSIPIATGSYSLSGENYIVNLSGFFGGETWSSMDDEFKIIELSGNISSPTNYLTNQENIFNMSHNLLFTGNRSGHIIFIDRAGNTGTRFFSGPNTRTFTIKAHPQGRLVTSSTPNPNFATIAIVRFYDLSNNFITESSVTTNNFGTGAIETRGVENGDYHITFQGLSHLQSVMQTITVDNTINFFDFSSGYITRANGLIKNDIVTYIFDYTNLMSYNYTQNLSIEALFTYQVRDALKLNNINQTGQQQSIGVLRTGLSLGATTSGNIYFESEVLDPDHSNLLNEPNYFIYSGSTDITNDGAISTFTGTNITSVEIVGEIVKDGEINGVDSSVLVDYIAINGVTNTNTGFGYVLEDLNANGQVDAADITILGFNLYRTNILLP